jgi:hypothetical protein
MARVGHGAGAWLRWKRFEIGGAVDRCKLVGCPLPGARGLLGGLSAP